MISLAQAIAVLVIVPLVALLWMWMVQQSNRSNVRFICNHCGEEFTCAWPADRASDALCPDCLNAFWDEIESDR